MRLLILILILAQGVAGQSVLRVGSFTDPFTMDPHRTSHQGHFIYFAQLFESPLECMTDHDGRVAIRAGITDLPVISADGLTLTFKVRGLSRFVDDPCFPPGK